MSVSALLLWLVGGLAGSMVFFGAVVAPLVFRVLSTEDAGTFLRAFFPVYYVWGFLVAVIAAFVGVFADWLSAGLCVLVALGFVFARQFLIPKINAARDASMSGDAAATARFQRLHRSSVVINGGQLIILLVVAGRLIW